MSDTENTNLDIIDESTAPTLEVGQDNAEKVRVRPDILMPAELMAALRVRTRALHFARLDVKWTTELLEQKKAALDTAETALIKVCDRMAAFRATQTGSETTSDAEVGETK